MVNVKVKTRFVIGIGTWFPSYSILLIIFLLVFSSNSNNGCQSLHLTGTFQSDTFFLFLSKFGFQKTETWNKNHTQGYIYGNITDVLDTGLDPFLPTTTTVTPSTLSPSKLLPSTSPPLHSKVPVSSPSSLDVSAAALLSTNNSSTLSANPSSRNTSTNVSSSTTSTSSTSTTTTTPKPKPVPKHYPVTLVVVDRSYFLDFYKFRNSNREDRNTACQIMFQEISHGNGCTAAAKVDFHKFLRRLPCSKNGICSDETNLTSVVGESQFTFPIENKNEAK